MRAILLAAGDGTRLGANARGQPKPLVRVGGKPLITFVLGSLAQAGVHSVCIVLGYKGRALQESIGDGRTYGVMIDYVHNPWWQQGNATSLWAAMQYLEHEPFLLCMADHVVSPALLRLVLERRVPPSLLAVDFSPSERNAEEGTRVQMDGNGVIRALGKNLTAWQGIDTGVFLLDPSVVEAMRGFMLQPRHRYDLSDALNHALDAGCPLHACEVSGYFWQDVDTLEDIAFLNSRLETHQIG